MDPTLRDVLARLERVSGQLEELRDGMRQAVAIADLDPDMALTRARKVLEFIVRDVYQRHIGKEAGTQPLENLLQRLVKDGHLPEREAVYANAVRGLGNVGTHVFGKKVKKSDVMQSLEQLTVVLEWYFENERPAERGEAAPVQPGTAAVSPTVPFVPAPPAKPSRRRTLPFIVPVALTVGVLLVLSAFLLPPVRAWLFPPANPVIGPPAPVPVAVQATPTAFKGYIDVVVYDPDDPRRQNVRLNEPDVLPLKPGDHFAVTAEINPPAYLYILWIDADGSVDPVYPWKPGHWDERPAEERPVSRLRRPEASDRPFGGTYSIKESVQGMETLVLLARETPLPQGVDLKAALGPVRPQTLRTLRSTVWFENGAVVKNEPGRSAVDWGDEKTDDAVWVTQEQIRAQLGRLFPYSRAVSFAVRGK